MAVVEVNHFDDWETSDVSVTERVAASLAVAEQEAMEEERQQQRQQAGGDGGGGGGDGGSITSTTSTTAPASSSKSRQMVAYDTILLPASSVCESEGSGEGSGGEGGGGGGGGTGVGPERRSSPPLPENDVSPRSCAFMLPVNAVLVNSVPRFTMRSGGGRGGRG